MHGSERELGWVTTPSTRTVTSCYFIQAAEAIASPQAVRVMSLDIRDYGEKLEIIQGLPSNSCLGLVSLSFGILSVGEIIIRSLRGEDLFVITAQAKDTYNLNVLIHSAHTIICDGASYTTVKEAILAASNDLIRRSKLIQSENYINTESINLLKRELGLVIKITYIF